MPACPVKLLFPMIRLVTTSLLWLALLPGHNLFAHIASDGNSSVEKPAIHPPAKSEQERYDFKAAFATTGANAAEIAANNFASRYPDSELRQYLYSRAMQDYELENNPAGTLAMAQKVLALNPDHVLALVLKATILANSLETTDPDHAKKANEILRDATLAIESVSKGFI